MLEQTQKLSDLVPDVDQDYCQRKLSDSLPIIEIPGDRPRQTSTDNNYDSYSFQLKSETMELLDQFSVALDISVNKILFATFLVLLYRYTNLEELALASYSLGRTQDKTQPIVLRADLADDPNLADLVSQVQKIVSVESSKDNESLASTIEELLPEQGLAHFRVWFEFKTQTGRKELYQQESFDLKLTILRQKKSFFVDFQYNCDLYDASTIVRIAEHWQTLIFQSLVEPQQSISKLTMLAVEEQERLLAKWNQTKVEYPNDKLIYQLFEAQVAKNPAEIAVVFEDKKLTYAQLNQKANQLAHYLQTLGVQPEVLVGICIERSLEMVISLLAILKAGGAYVPFDPHYPEDRLSYMLNDSGVKVLLSQQSLIESLPSHQAQVFCLDSDWEQVKQFSQENLNLDIGAENLAYVIYTSGSTGKPKGVLNTHQGIHNRLCWMQDAYGLDGSDRVLQKTPFSFDVSVWEFFWTLITGATMVVAKPEGHKDSNYLIDLITKEQITTMHFVPSMLQVFLQEPNVSQCSSLKRVFCSGEALPFELTKRFFERLQCQLHNLYGPTEAAIDVTFWQCQPEDDLSVVPIGHPIANTQAYILDKHLKPLPVGVIGELHLGGINLARGYLNRPELTQEKFISNPFTPEISTRLYKTGDLARYRQDGNIEYMGRIDHQVKLRGFRIELGEIEAVLNTHPQIQQAVVLATDDPTGNKRLVAYLTTAESPEVNELKDFLAAKLPEYMVPAIFVPLETIPLTPNGKVNRRALPAPDIRQEMEKAYQAPTNSQEQLISDIWQSVLNLEQISIDDNFFELGGNSLFAMQIVGRIMQQVSTINLSINSLFELPTIKELAQVIEGQVQANPEESDRFTQEFDYWKTQLADAPPLLELPTDRARPIVQNDKGDRVEFQLSGDLTQSLNSLSDKEGVTLDKTLLAAFKALLYRYTGQTDVVVGSPFANLNSVDKENSTGYSVNTLALRTNFTDDLSFQNLLSQVQEVTSEAYAHANLPFAQLIKKLQLELDLSYNPLVQVMFAWQNTQAATKLGSSIVGEISSPESLKVSMFDLTLKLEATATGIKGYFEYKTDLFDRATIFRMVGHWQNLLTEIVANPQSQISRLPLLTNEEKQTLHDWNPDPSFKSQSIAAVYRLFEAQVDKNPNAIALVFGELQLTYQELNQKANQLAHYLQSLGVGADSLVGICLERSLETIISVLGILKAGGAYVPFDPTYPAERIAYIVEDSNLSVLLTQSKWQAKLPESQAQMIYLDTDWAQISQASNENPVLNNSGENLVYVIYTSGSTGKPKGVMITHQCLGYFIPAAVEAFGITSCDRFLQFASISFDMAVEEIFPVLCTGATLVLRSDAMIASAQTFFQACADLQITAMDLPTAFWHQMTTELIEKQVSFPESLRLIMIGGEAVKPDPIKVWQEYINKLGKSEQLKLMNGYGPTETTANATTYHIPRDTSAIIERVPIGKPMANTQAYILDQHLQPVPLGVVGELYLGGVSLARGYLNRPELTQEKFIPNPLPQEISTSSRLYKTGDLARYCNDGNLEYMGRIDDQVKVRGFRIELGEIEAVLDTHPQIRQAVVITAEDLTGNNLLVAYVATDDDLEVAQLREFIATKLPTYMIPAVFITLDSIPLTSRNKVDRRALPVPDLRRKMETSYQAPTCDKEKLIADIWQEILNLEKVGISDNFLELGGNSLLAMQIITQINHQLEINLPLNSLLDLPTIKQLAQFIESDYQGDCKAITSIQPFDRNQELPLSSGEQSLCFFELLNPQNYVYNLPHTFTLSGQVDIEILEQSLNQIISRHEIFRTSFNNKDGKSTKTITENLSLKLSVTDVATEDQAKQIAHQEAHQPLDLTQAPLFRVRLLCLPEDHYWLVFTCHHIIFDGWSEYIFFDELRIYYDALSNNQQISLPKLEIQYVDYAHWQQQWLQSAQYTKELGYWRSQLAGAPALMELPTDRPRPMVQSHKGDCIEFELSSDLTESINSLSRQKGVTLYMTLLAAFNSLLYRYTGQPDIVVGSPFANRNSIDTENLLGYFVNTLVLRNILADDLSFQDLLSQVRKVTSGAYTNANLPFDKLVEELQPKRDLSYNPLFQVMFVLQKQQTFNQPDSSVTWEIGSPSMLDSSMFDLGLQLQETETGIKGHFEYNTDLFDRETIARMVGHLQTLLAGIVADPQTKIAHLPLLTKNDKQTLIERNPSLRIESPPIGVQQLFESQVEENPDAIAVVFGDSHLTYEELNQKSNQLAHHLQSLGVGAEVLVGLCVEKSLEMIIGMWGILKAGGAYVPLDPTYPPERLAYMVEDATISILLTQTKLQGRIPASQAQIVDLDGDWPLISNYSDENPEKSDVEDPLAYIIYTSGSTGKPKGVMINHRSLSYFIRTAIEAYRLTPRDRMLQFASINFDVAVEEIFPTLCSGATLVLRSAAMVADVGTFFQACTDLKLTIINLPTAYWHQLTAELGSKNISLPEALKLVIIGGEAALTERVKSWQEYVNKSGKQDHLKLVNSYGPTETTVSATMYEIPTDTSVITGEVPIGLPMANLQTYILDKNQQPAPIGVPGELYIGGDSLARGYLNRPKLTLERFIPIPDHLSFIAKGHDNRLYRTGDLVRYLPNGEIEYLGRIDNQVKIRGFRIELGEIESMLSQHPEVKEVAVSVHKDNANNKRLIAYLVSSAKSLQSQELRSFLKERLPSYMVPSGFVFLDEMPLMPNGKLDRRALPAPDLSREVDSELVAPTNDVEAKLAEIWSEILNIKPISIEDDFFELGGHSLLAVKLMGEIESQFNRKLPLATLFEAPTIQKLGTILQKSGEATSFDSLVTLKKGNSSTPLFLIHDADGETILYLNLANYLKPEQTVYGLRPPSPKSKTDPILYTRISEIAAYFIKEIRKVQPKGPYLVGGLCAGGVLAFEIACQLQAQGEQVPLVAIIDSMNIQGISHDGYRTQVNENRKQNFLKVFEGEGEKNSLKSLTKVLKVALTKVTNVVSYEVTSRSKNFTDNLGIKLLRYCLDRQLAIPKICQNLSVRSIYSFAEEDPNREQFSVYQGQLTLWRATEKLDMDNPAIDDTPVIFDVEDPLFGWGEQATQGVAAHDIPGGHSSMLQEPHVETLAEKLQPYIDSAVES